MSIQTYLSELGRAVMGRNQPETRCVDCEQKKDEELSFLHDFDRIAAQDPQLSGGHDYATDAEWVEYLNGQEGSRP